MKIPCSFLIMLLYIFSIEAAAPGTHVYFAQLWRQHNTFGPDQEHAFIAGNLFPDIRYLGTIDRDSTHEKHLTAAMVRKTPNSFKAGMRLHAYVDEQRAYFVKKSKIESYLKNISKDTRVLFLKLLEDEILWDRIDTSEALIAMETIFQEEHDSNAGEAALVEWHKRMNCSLSQCPSEFLKSLANADLGFLKADLKTVKEWSKLLPRLAKDPIFIEYTEKMVKYTSREFSP